MEAKGSSGQFLAYNTYATLPTTNPLFPGFSSYQNVNKEIIQENITECTGPRKHCAFGVFFVHKAKSAAQTFN